MGEVKYNCSECLDTRHVFKEGVWKRCSCLLTDIEQKKQIVAGISIRSEELTLEGINLRFSYSPVGEVALSILRDIEKTFKKGVIPIRRACIQGMSIGPKDVVVQTLLKAGVEAGLKVRQYSMEELIAQHFKEDDYNGLEEDFKKYNIFSLYFGAEIQHNVGATFLQELIRYSYKYGVYLLLNTCLSLDSLKIKYDEGTEKLFLRLGAPTDINDKRIVFVPLEK